jgi:hypothetical protein
MERTVKQRTMRKSTAVSVQSLRHRARGDLFRYRRHQPRFGDVPGVDRQGARSVVPNDGFISAVPYVLGTIEVIVWEYLSDRMGERRRARLFACRHEPRGEIDP